MGQAAMTTIDDEPEVTAETQGAVIVPLNKIKIKPDFNVRSVYEDIDQLANAIHVQGLLEPLVIEDGKVNVWIIAGHRRYLAHMWLVEHKKMAPDHGVLCIVKSFPNECMAKVANLTENVSKRDLKNYDKARRFHEFENKYGMSRKKIAQFSAVSLSQVTQLINCIDKLSPTILEAWKGADSVAHEIPLTRLMEWKKYDEDKQLEMFAAFCDGDEDVIDTTPDDKDEDDDDEKGNKKLGKKKPSVKQIRAIVDRLQAKKKDGEGLTDFEAGVLKMGRFQLGEIVRVF